MEGAPPDFERALWKDPRWSKWSFRNTARFLSAAHVAPSTKPRQLQIGECPQPTGWHAFLENTHASSAILVQAGKVSAAEPANTLTDPEPHMLFSITKSIIGLTALLLIDHGVVKPEGRVSFYLPDLRKSAFGNARVGELLSMTDGVPFDETYSDPEAQIHIYSRAYWGDAADGVRAQIAALPLRRRTAGFSYRTPVVDVLGAVLTAATGRSLSELVGDLLWRPMGAAHPAHFVLDTAGAEIAGAGFNAASSDLARMALLLLDGGSAGYRQIIPERIVSNLFSGGDRRLFARGYKGRPGWSYRDLWWHMGGRRIAALGVYGQRLIIDSEQQFALIRTGTQPEPDNKFYDRIHDELLEEIGKLQINRPAHD